MMNYDLIKFKGTFRPYQERVLSNSCKYLENGKINIVAAPGSGKTILGLELIRKLNKPALIISPSITIREQWISRFKENFIDEKDNNVYCSNTVKKPELITSITYQGLYSAYNRLKENEKEVTVQNDEDELIEKIEDFSNFDLIKTILDNDISTICLDEAHHLRAEWQRTLTEFLKEFEKKFIIIALTATPPYDSDVNEWNKYIEMCGDIDEEIFIPELVRNNTLCPHQDYIYLNYPSAEEEQKIKEYKENVDRLTSQIFYEKKVLNMILDNIVNVFNSKSLSQPNKYSINVGNGLDRFEFSEKLLDYPLFLKAILSFLKVNDRLENRKLTSLIGGKNKIPDYDLTQEEILLQGIIDDKEFFKDEDREELKKTLYSYGVIERKKVLLSSNSKLDKIIVSSIGKLDSIVKITDFESKNLNGKIRLLILTDYIKNNTELLGSDKEILEFGVIPIFELVRRNNSELKLSAVSGKIIIVPNSSLIKIKEFSESLKVKFNIKPIRNTLHSEIVFEGLNSHQKIDIITRAFNEGIINAIVGTKSLLGEGWDSPVINTLIIASNVGSFMLSNQMRGRAIRIDKNDADKVSNIWHLATVIPPYLNYEKKSEKINKKFFKPKKVENIYKNSLDFEMIERRFNSFVGLNYSNNVIENGINRIDVIKPPFDKDRVDMINQKSLYIAKDRKNIALRWINSLDSATDEVLIEKEQKTPVLHIKFIFNNILFFMIYSSLIGLFSQIFYNILLDTGLKSLIILIPLYIVAGKIYMDLIKKILLYFSPTRLIKKISDAVLQTLIDIELIDRNARLETDEDNYTFNVRIAVSNCSNFEKNIFFNAINTLLNPIENPRYIIMKSGYFKDYSLSFAVPEIIGNKKENVQVLEHYLSKILGSFSLYYTRNEDGRKLLEKCRRRSYISQNYKQIYGKKRLKQIFKSN